MITVKIPLTPRLSECCRAPVVYMGLRRRTGDSETWKECQKCRGRVYDLLPDLTRFIADTDPAKNSHHEPKP